LSYLIIRFGITSKDDVKNPKLREELRYKDQCKRPVLSHD